MNNKFRLSSTAFDREEEEEKILPQKIYFLFVEGNDTEKILILGKQAVLLTSSIKST